MKKISVLFIILVFSYISLSFTSPAHAEMKQPKVAIIDYWSEYLLDPRGRVIWGYNMGEENLPANWLKEALEANGFYVKIIKLHNTIETGVSIDFSEFDVLIIWRGDFRFSTELVDKIRSASKPLLLIGFAGYTFLNKVYDFNDRGQPSAHLSTYDTMYIHVPSNIVRHTIFNIPNRINIENGLVRIASSNIQVYACEIKKTANIEVVATLPNNEDYAPFVIYYNPDIYAIFWGFNTYNMLKQDFDYQKDLLINMVYYLSHERPVNYFPDNREKVRTVDPIDPNKATPPLLWMYTTIGPVDGTIWATAVSKNGTYIAAGGNDGFVYLFHRSNNVPLWIFDTRSRVRSIDISHKGYVVVGVDSGELFVLDINSLKLIHKYYLRSEYYFRPYLRGIAVSISKDNDFIAAVRGYKVFLFNIGATSPLWEYFSPDDQFISVDISNDGSYIVVGSYSIYSKSKVIIFSSSSNKPLLVYEVPRAVASVAISGDGNYVVAGSEDNNIYFFSVKEKRLLWTYQTHGYVWAVSISNDGKYVVAASLDGKIYALSGLSGEMIWSYQAGEPSPPNAALGLWSVDISSDGKYCVTGTAEPYGYVYLFDCINGKLVWRQDLPEAIRTVSISDDGSTIVAGTVGVLGVSGVIGVYTSISPPPTPLVCSIVGMDVLSTGTVVINGVTYPVLDVVIRTRGGCGDVVKVVMVIPDKDPYDKQPVLSCDLISKTQVNDISEKAYRCIARWNYLAPPNWVEFAFKAVLTAIQMRPEVPLKEKIAWAIAKLTIGSAELLSTGKPIVLINVTYVLQVDSSNKVNLIVQAPPSKVSAINWYLTAKAISAYAPFVGVGVTVICLAGILTGPICPIIGAIVWGVGTLAPFVLQHFAYDPYSEDYTVIYEVPPPSDRIRELAGTYGDIIYDLYYYVNYLNASMISISRAFTAYEKGDYYWYTTQLSKAYEYAEKSQEYFERVKASLSNELTKIEPYINKTTFEYGLKYIEENGLPNETAEILKELGLLNLINTTEIVETAREIGYIEVNPRELLDAMPNPGQEIKNYIKTLEEEITTTPTTTTITTTITATYTTTQTMVVPTVVTTTYITTTTIPTTYTTTIRVYETTTVVKRETVTTTSVTTVPIEKTIEKTTTLTIAIPETVTTTSVVTVPVEKTATLTVTTPTTVYERVVDWSTAIPIATVLLAIGIAIGYLIKKR